MVKKDLTPEEQEEKERLAALANATREQAEMEFLNQSQEAPPREVPADAPKTENKEGDPGFKGGVTSALQGMSDMTDMQYAAYRLFPPEVKTRQQVEDLTMFARIDPQIFLSQIRLNSESEIMTSDPEKPIDVNLVYRKHYNMLSKGLDSLGIWDMLELAGAAREEKKGADQLKSILAG